MTNENEVEFKVCLTDDTIEPPAPTKTEPEQKRTSTPAPIPNPSKKDDPAPDERTEDINPVLYYLLIAGLIIAGIIVVIQYIRGKNNGDTTNTPDE